MFNEEEEELVRAVEEGLITPPSSEVAEKDSAFAAPPLQIVDQSRLSYQWNDDFLGPPLGTSNGKWDERFESFQRVCIGSTFYDVEDHLFQERNSKRLNTN